MSSPEPSDISLASRIEQIYAAPTSAHIGAFFDFDGTLIHGFSAVDFYLERLRRGQIGPAEALRTITMALRGITSEEDFEKFVAQGFKAFAGLDEATVLNAGADVFRKRLASRIFPEAWALVEAHRRQGHTVVLASSATRFQLAAAAETLGIDHVLSTGVEVGEDGLFTGRADGPSLWRAGKAQAVQDFAKAHDVDLAESYAYSNGTEDIPFLDVVGHPAATSPEDGLRQHALGMGWPVLDFASRGTPGPVTLARSAAGFGGLVGGIATGLGLSVLNGRRRGVDSMIGLSGDISLALAGVTVETIGEEHLWSHRPAVFIFNHQSQLDVPIMCHLLRRGFTGVAKKELMKDPIFGPAFRFAGAAFVDRQGGGDPRAALAPAAEKLREGVSIAIAPEGTRSVTPTLGRFKTGAFHLARQAGVPVVPVVIRNAGQLMWRDSLVIRPGTVDVVVHPPLDVVAWRDDDVRANVDLVQQGYSDTLAHWPGEPISVPAPAPRTRRAKKSTSKRTVSKSTSS